jgi:hypothetical protein
MEAHTDISNPDSVDFSDLEKQVQNRAWIGEEIDRFLGWEIFTRFVFIGGGKNNLLDFRDFCDRIPVSKDYVYVIKSRIAHKAKQYAGREDFRSTYVRKKRA